MEPIDLVFTPSVIAKQEQMGSRKAYAGSEWPTVITEDFAAFVETRDSFYLATASAAGVPTIQHRGGPPGFLKVLGPKTLAFADFRGNRQYITVGNLAENDRVCLFLMDYPGRQRVKVWGRARAADDPALIARLMPEGIKAKAERAIVIDVELWSSNCPQHITPRYTADVIDAAMVKLKERILELEAEIERLKNAAPTALPDRPKAAT